MRYSFHWIFVLLFCLPVIAHAQKVSLQLTATPIDAITEVTLPQVRISLLSAADSAVIDTFRRYEILGGALKRYTYLYQKDHVALPAKYIVCLTGKGYETLYKNLEIQPNEAKHNEVAHDLGRLRLQRERHRLLGEATVTASKIMMVMKGDTLVYNADAFQLAEGSMLDELIQQLPGVRLEENGRITVNGHFVSSLLVNGKDFFNGDPNVALQNLPAYMVNKVKAYQKTPDNAYLTRSSDEKGPRADDPWVLDIALKRQYAQGYIANVEAAHSVHQKSPFLGRFFAMRFTDHSRIAAYATGNNINMHGTPQTDFGSWEENMKKEGRTKTAGGGAFFYVENKSRKIRYNSTLKANNESTDLKELTAATSFLPETASPHTTSHNNKRDKKTYAEWNNSLTFVFPKTYIRFSPNVAYTNEHRRGKFISATGNRLLGYEGLDSVITKADCGADFLNLLYSESQGRTHRWNTSGRADTEINLKKLHMNALSLQGSYDYNHERGYNLQHYNLLTADKAADRRNRYDNQPGSSYKYGIIAQYPIIYQYRIRKINILHLKYYYTQQFSSSERMLFRLDKLGNEWMPDEAPLGKLPSTADLYKHCIDSLNAYHRTNFHRFHTAELSWYYQTENLHIRAGLPLNVTHERLSEWRPEEELSHLRKQVYVSPQFSFKLKGLGVRFDVQHQSPSQILMLDICDNSNPLSVFRGNPSLKSSNKYNLVTEWSGFKQDKMRQWRLCLYLYTIKDALGQLRQFDPQTGGYTYTPWNIDGNRGITASGSYFQPIDGKRHWLINLGTEIQLNRSADFAGVGPQADYRKSIVHNLHVSPSAGLDYRRAEWHAAFKASADWERLTSAQNDFETLCQVDMLYTLSLKAPLPFDVKFTTDLNLFMRRGYGEQAMNTDEWVWNAGLSRSIDRRKVWLLKLTAHDLLGQLSAVRRQLNAQGRTETISNTITRYVMLHLVWRFNKKPQKE